MKNTGIRLSDGSEAAISHVHEEDATEIISYTKAVAAESDNLTFGVGEFNTTLDQIRSLIKNVSSPNGGLMLKARIAGDLASILLIRGTDRPRIRHIGTLGMTVRRRYWGQGLGHAMCKAALSEARTKGISRIELRVRADNVRAIRLYEAVGFIHEGRLKHSFYFKSDYHDELMMAALLDAID